MSRLLPILVVLALCFAAGGVNASTFMITDDELDRDIFPEVAESIRANLDHPELHHITPVRKQQVLELLTRMEATVADENETARRRNAIRSLQRRINSILLPSVAKNDGQSEVICKRVREVGTKIPSTHCRTREELRQDTHDANEAIRRWTSSCVMPPCA